jgi:glycosyltransferase involved in cell wall biosynthesis
MHRAIKNIVIAYDFASLNGGAAKVAIEEAIGLSNAGFNVFYFASVGPVSEQLERSGVTVVCLGQRDILNEGFLRASIQGVYNADAIRAFESLLREQRFQPEDTVIHLHGWTKALSPFIVSVGRRHGIRTVTTLHDFSITCPNGGYLNYPETTVCKVKPLSFDCLKCNCDPRAYTHKLWRYARAWVQTFAARVFEHSAAVITVSEFQKAILAKHLRDSSRMRVLENPMSCEQSTPADPGAADSYLFVGRFSSEKGALLFAEAAKGAGVRAIFVGRGEKEAEIREILPDAEFPGWLSPAAVTDRMRSARAVVFPSLWYETAGYVAYEAMAQGTPVICSDITAATEVVRHERNGLLFESGSVESLREAILRLANVDEARVLGRNAYEDFWAKDRSLETHLEGLLDIYESVLPVSRVARPVTA